MSLYLVQLNGCDDTTKALVELSQDDAETVQRVLAAVSSCSGYGCQPTGVLAPWMGAPPEGEDFKYVDYDDLKEVAL